MAVGDAVFYDPHTFRKRFKNIGRAYREQATTLIEMCRLYVEASPQTYIEDDGLQNVFRLADAALIAAGASGKNETSEAGAAFLRVQEAMKQFGSPPPRKDLDSPGNHRTGSHRKQLPDPSTALATASMKDAQSRKGFLSKIMKSRSPEPPKGPTMKVNFVIRKSPPGHEHDLIVLQEINNTTTASEIMWRFSRYPKDDSRRFTPKQNPHFYLQLAKDAASYDSRFKQGSLKDFAHSLRPGDPGPIYVLLDKSCRLFLDAAQPHIPRIFGNLWKPHQTVILKDIVGDLSSEDIVLRNIGENQDYWHRPKHRPSRAADPSPGRVQPDNDSEIVKNPVRNGRAMIDAALRVQNVDLMIRDRTMPEPPKDWKPLPSSEPSARVQEREAEEQTEEQTTPKQLATHLPYPEHSIPSTSTPSIGSSTLFGTSTSTESSETAVNASDASLARGAPATGRPAQPERPRVSTVNITSRSRPTALPDEPTTTPPSLPGSWQESGSQPRSAPPVRKDRRRNWFQAYIYDYGT